MDNFQQNVWLYFELDFIIQAFSKHKASNVNIVKFTSWQCSKFLLHDDLLLKTGKRMLYVTRKINLAEFVYKVLYDMAPPVENPFFTRQVTPYDMRDNFKLIKPVSKWVSK